ncbi:MAG: glycosyltransferase [bacterium]|nr:glycosyltransferase [bacterium]
MKKLSIVIPCYNESKTIRELLRRVESAPMPGWQREVIIVDDGSRDGTRDILKGYASRMKVIFQAVNGGKGTAVRRGLKEATGEYALIQDADLEYDPGEIKDLLAVVDRSEADVVYGSRNIHPTKREGFLISRAGVWFITKLMNVLYGLSLTDAWTCYKLFPREAGPDFSAGHFESELLFTAALARRGYRFAEVAISHNPRLIAEGKKIRYRDGIYAILVILLDRLAHLRKSDVRFAQAVPVPVVCPLCKGALPRNKEGYICPAHGVFPIDWQNRPLLIEESMRHYQGEEHLSGVNWLKSFLKQFPLVYYGIWHVFCPVLMVANGPRKIRRFVEKGTPIFDIGSGPERLGEEFVNVDAFPFPGVDIVADAARLPFKDGSIAAVVTESMLEHVADAETVASEMMRVLRKGGVLYASAPFIHPYHASPDDFNRWTISGLKKLFSGLEIVESGVRSGPWSAFLMFLAYYLGIIFSFGSKKAAPFLAHVFMLALGPFKYLDFFFMHLPGSDAVAAHLYVIGRKR